ncbi:MAG: hypothetical protein PWP31_109 [Clostridia bacterium]|nr:hypothetical protein [Clostridia bacterium]
MPKGRELVGLPVINEDEGDEIGRVRDILFEENQIKAFILDNGNWLRHPRLVYFHDLKDKGPKTFTIVNKNVLKQEIPEGMKRWQEIKGFRIYNTAGQDLGLLEDLIVELPSGEIIALEISTGLINDLIDGRKEISLTGEMNWGKDSFIV